MWTLPDVSMPWSLDGGAAYRERFCSFTLSQGFDIGSNHAGRFNDCFARVFDYIYLSPLDLVHTLARFFLTWVGLCNTGWAGFQRFEVDWNRVNVQACTYHCICSI